MYEISLLYNDIDAGRGQNGPSLPKNDVSRHENTPDRDGRGLSEIVESGKLFFIFEDCCSYRCDFIMNLLFLDPDNYLTPHTPINRNFSIWIVSILDRNHSIINHLFV